MKRKRRTKGTGKPVFFIVAVLIVAVTYLAFFGLDNYYGDNRTVYVKGAEDIRWGIDIRGGVEAIFMPDIKADNITDSDMDSAKFLLFPPHPENKINITAAYIAAVMFNVLKYVFLFLFANMII